MTKPALGALLFTSVLTAAAAVAAEGGLPKEQPKYITISREMVKVGKAAEHAKHEAGWPAAYEKAKSPDYYIAMTSLTGPPEAWYISPWESHAALGESMKRDMKDEKLDKELDRLAAGDAEFINGVNNVQAVALKDLSLGAFPDVGKVRFFEITVFRVRNGSENLFREGAKAYAEASKRANPDASYRMYQVLAGMPSPTFLAISSVNSFGEFDKRMESEQAMWKGATQEEMTTLQRCGAEAIAEMQVNRYRVDPRQSYVPQAVRDSDPDFWKGK